MSILTSKSGLIQQVTPSQRTELYKATVGPAEIQSHKDIRARGDVDAPTGVHDNASKWNVGASYVVGDYVEDGGVYYSCVTDNTGDQPPSASWSEVGAAYGGVAAFGIYVCDEALDGAVPA